MCFSERLSIGTLGLGLGFSGLVTQLPKPEDKVIGIFLAFVSLMQGVEALLWRHQHCDSYNRVLTAAGMWLNHLQPLVLLILCGVYFPSSINMIVPFGVVYTVAMLLYTSQQEESRYDGKCTLKDLCTPHLRWKWNEMSNYRLFYLLFLIILFITPLLTFQNATIAKSISFAGGLAWSISAAIYPPYVVGALWCFFTAFLPGIYYSLRITNIL
jgi:hypothetical protein